MESAFLSSPAEALEHFQVLAENGLSADQVQKNLKKYGPNGMTHACATIVTKLIKL